MSKRIVRRVSVTIIATLFSAGVAYAVEPSDQFDYLYAAADAQVNPLTNPPGFYHTESIIIGGEFVSCVQPQVNVHITTPNFTPQCVHYTGNTAININNFASEAQFQDLQSQISALGSQATAQFASFTSRLTSMQAQISQFGQNLHDLGVQADQGTAMAFAMSGVSALQADETFGLSANIGTYGGQTAAAYGAALRINQHVSANGGVAFGLGHSGKVGGRFGIHVGW
jgi:hypothetical protein